jgi:hypothetical protein
MISASKSLEEEAEASEEDLFKAQGDKIALWRGWNQNAALHGS